MPVAVQVGGGGSKAETPLDIILKGLTIAGQGFGIASDIKKLNTSSDPSELDIAKAGFRKKVVAPASPVAAGPANAVPALSQGPLNATPENPAAEGPRFKSLPEYKIGEETYTSSGDEEKYKEVEGKLRDKWTSNPITQRSSQVSEAYQKLRSTLDKPGLLGPADLASVFLFMHTVEPGSAVKEGEFANAENAGGIPSAIRNAYNKMLSGQRLPEELRKEFGQVAYNIAHGQKKMQDIVDDQYRGLVKDEGFQEKNVILPLFKDLDKKLRAEKKSPAPPIEDMSREEKQKKLIELMK